MLQLLAQAADDYSLYSYQTTTSDNGSFPVGLILVYLVLAVLMIVSMWKVFQKAGKPGWAAIVPFYNTWVLLQIVGKPSWWFFLYFVPFVNVVVAILVYVELAKCFGRGVGFAILTVFLPFIAFPMLAFGKDQYHAPSTDASGGTSSQPNTPANQPPVV